MIGPSVGIHCRPRLGGSGPFIPGPETILPWLEAKYFVSGTGTQTVATAQAFLDPVESFSIAGSAPAGVTINSATGVVSVTTGSAYAWATVTVRGTAADGGYSDVTLELRVITPTHTINLGTGQSYWSVSPTAGSIVVVRAGTSSEVWYLGDWDGVEVFAYPGETAVINASALTADNALDIGNANGLAIYGLEVIGGAGADFGIGGWGATNIRIQSCDIHGFQRGSIYTGHNTHATSRPHTIRYCDIHDNVRENAARAMTSGWGSGIVLDLADGSLVERNRVYENFGEGIRALACDGVTIRENDVHDNFSANVYLDNVQGAAVSGNRIWSNNAAFYRDFDGAGAGGFLPAKSVLAANEEYPSQLWLEQTSSGLVVTGNFILSSNALPYYDGSYGAGGGAGSGSVFTPNATFAPAVSYPLNKTFTLPALSTATHTITMPDGVVENDTVWLSTAADQGGAADQLQSAGWTTLINDTAGSSPGRLVAWKRMGAVPDTSVSLKTTGGDRVTAGLIQVWNGLGSFIAASTPVNVVGGMPDAPSLNVTSQPARVFAIGIMDDDDAASVTAPAGYSNVLASNTGLGSTTDGATVMIASKVVTVTGAEDPGAFGGTGDDGWYAITAAFNVTG